jgi:eukaryotic-like serine/threonine-protein kinase
MQPPQGAAASAYELVLPLATGKMAEIYVARRSDAGGPLVAIKRIRTELQRDPTYVTMLLDEARLASHIQSPHVTSILDCGLSADGAPFIVMELVFGATLAQIAAVRRPLPVSDALEILAQAAEGLHAAHEARDGAGQPLHIVHRDVSPTNILVGLDGRTRVCDFGIAWAERRATATLTGQVRGTLNYLSPEQTRAERVDRRSDVFSLGAVSFELLTGKVLFSGTGMMAIIHAILERPIPPLHRERSDVPEAVTQVLARALERDRDARFPTAAAFGHALRAAAKEIGEASQARIGALVAETMPAELRSLPSSLGISRLSPEACPPGSDAAQCSRESEPPDDPPTLQEKPKPLWPTAPQVRARKDR